MADSDHTDQFIPAGLASLGIEADEIELAVINAAHEMFWPAIRALIEFDTSTVEPEPQLDLSKAPAP